MNQNKYKPVSLEQQLTYVKTAGFSNCGLHSLAHTVIPLALYLLCCICSTGCAGQKHTARAAEPIRWGRTLLQQNEEWYAGSEAVRIADNLLLYQRNKGGWHKNTDMAKVLSDEEKEVLLSEAEKEDIATIDNGATFTQLEYLARVYEATGQDTYKESFLRGVDYLLKAQYENGGWPQYYPIKKGYYEHITFNDGAMIGVMHLLNDVAQRKAPYTFVDAARRNLAAKAIEKGLYAILQTQIKVDGKLTAWCAQHDRYDFSPQKARAYELPSISGGESVGIIKYLMEIDNPSPDVVRSVEGAVSWLERVKITGVRVDRVKEPSMKRGYNKVVVKDSSAPPLWARFYDIETNHPMFVGRDGIVRDKLSEIEEERRNGYSWYVNSPQELLEKDYPRWKQKQETNQ